MDENTLLLIPPKKPKHFNVVRMLCLREVTDMPGPPPGAAWVTPNDDWNKAHTATVEVGNNPPAPNDIYPNVDIIFVRWTQALITIWKADHPQGVVVLNDNPPPADAQPIKTEVHTNVHWKKSLSNSETVDLIRNAGWPAGEIILW